MIRNVLTGAGVLAAGLALLAVTGLRNLRRHPRRYYHGLGERHTDGTEI